ncbi:type II toxin-antitoxin system VapC family toxin [[Mycobacterium] holstebronense]|uniref:Type II toxin-antitoxin system VapC family toxin n=1 Tax=[Mycobacterium] holstebronense TaxID=3064288 RepID=A0ABN9NTM6_9MYCO|nr:type II toxin-antitoxin system VapC family toxin [Mycolicibacter sp. MU0102]CAJ1510495.1 type II toxin-antitoxin system VapC family toxin [Mycolicibacter sp. MU0102]
MAPRVSVDTTFLIDLRREQAAGTPGGPAHRFLGESPDTELFLSTVALGEFAAGFERSDDPIIVGVRERHVLVPVDDAVALTYAEVSQDLRRRGNMIGSNDLWIGCTSLRLGIPVLTHNVADFRRIQGLGVISYR